MNTQFPLIVADGLDSHRSDIWFRRALAIPSVSRHVQVDGARLHHLAWNPEQRTLPSLILLHGFLGHAHWWDFIAPFLLDHFRVFALDFSGMGDSEHRDSYGELRLAQDVLGFIDVLGLAPATVIAHSYSGGRALRACVEAPGVIEHAILIDSYINFADTDIMPMFPALQAREPYLDLGVACSRFRLTPEQPVRWSELVEYIARQSLRRSEHGWSWKFDHRLTTETEIDGERVLRAVRASVDFVYGEHSAVVDRSRAERIVAALPRSRQAIQIPDAHHHIVFDEPLALISTLRALLA